MTLENLRTRIFADGAELDRMLVLSRNPHISGFTTNPTLMRKAGVSDYRAFAQSLLAKFPNDRTARIREGYERAFGRLPGKAEMEEALQFIEAAPRTKKDGEDGKDEIAAWSAWCQVLFAANEFVYRE